MKRICIISDTHGLLRETVKTQMAKADLIIHAGDIDTLELLQEIQQYGETYAVRGNNDKSLKEQLPLSISVCVEGFRFFVVHNKNDIPKDLTETDIVIYGHSHKYEENTINDVLYLNPGSCGKRRFNLELSLCRMIVNNEQCKYKKIIIE